MNPNVLRISSSTTNLEKIREFISDECKKAGLGEPEIYKIQLAVDEACTNVIKHAYQGNPDHFIDVGVSYDGHAILISIADNGIPFDSSHYHSPDLANFIKQRKRGGLGIQLIRSLMDEVQYARENNQNRVTLLKQINP